MQTLIQVVCTKGVSLRDAIANDPQLGRFGLHVAKKQQPGRAHGWAKIHSLKRDRRGAINLEWDADTSILLCRVVNRGEGKPSHLVGDFIDYLLERRRSRVQSISIHPRR